MPELPAAVNSARDAEPATLGQQRGDEEDGGPAAAAPEEEGGAPQPPVDGAATGGL
eukprot:COSAG06_NODE_33701_length_485_cov_1.326425_1_plen_55_part_01